LTVSFSLKVSPTSRFFTGETASVTGGSRFTLTMIFTLALTPAAQATVIHTSPAALAFTRPARDTVAIALLPLV
jgi:hypothetical protein